MHGFIAYRYCFFALVWAAVTAADWVADCQASGFDPEQLACSTCYNILPAQYLLSCQKCCQSWLDTKRISKPYEAAVLVDRGSGGDVATFLLEDWEDVVQAKGATRLQRLHHQAAPLQFNFYHHSQPSQLLFFDQTVTGVTDLTQLARKAVETVNLDGMKREDMKDMLLTLLP